MFNFVLYAVTVLIWGTTWIAIKMQLGDAPIEVSILLRFVLAGCVLFVLLTLVRKLQKLSLQDHLFCIAQGACLFCFNFYAFYTATGFISSGLTAVVFSLATVFNSVNGWVWYKKRPTRRVVIGGLLGGSGVALMFWPELQLNQFDRSLLIGVGLATLGTFLFSSGNMISVRHQNKGLRPPTTNAWSMLYGVLIMLAIIQAQNIPFVLDTRPIYLASLIYLAIPGTVIAFTTYLLLVGRIGAEQAAYTTVLFPVVALTVSTFVEDYHWTLATVIGFTLVLLGNLTIFAKRPKFDRLLRLQKV